MKYLNAAFLRDWLQDIYYAADFFLDADREAVPPKLVEKSDELESLQLPCDWVHVIFRSAPSNKQFSARVAPHRLRRK